MSRPATKQQPPSIAIIGAGLAGAACAQAFASKGYRVTVYDQGDTHAAGASGVPVAMFAPSVSADDAPHSRLLREGVHQLLAELNRLTQSGLLVEGQDWAMTGVLERCIRTAKKLPDMWLAPQDAHDLQSRMAGKPYSAWPAKRWHDELWHGAAGWVDPRSLISAWLAHPQIDVQLNSKIDDVSVPQADAIVVACGYRSAAVLPQLQGRLQSIRGQVEWGQIEERAVDSRFHGNDRFPVNGFGHFIQTPSCWLTGATFQRDESDLAPRTKDVELNFEKLATLMPELAKPELARLQKESVSWVGIRAAQKNRAPLVERVMGINHPQVWVCAGLGSRGLSLAALCANRLLLAAEAGLAIR